MEVNTTKKLHFVLIPWLSEGHIIPMIDIARLIAGRGITVSLITTPANLSRIKPAVDHISDSNLSIHFVPLCFPAAKFGLPEGCKNLDSVPSISLFNNFLDATKSLKQPLLLCLVLRGWAPQLMILSHPSVGGFITHCGWNSALEGISAGLPMATWPLFAEQFLNEKLLVEVLKIGVSVGVKQPTEWAGELKDEIVVGRQDVTRAIISLMEEGEEGEGRRQRVRESKNEMHSMG